MRSTVETARRARATRRPRSVKKKRGRRPRRDRDTRAHGREAPANSVAERGEGARPGAAEDPVGGARPPRKPQPTRRPARAWIAVTAVLLAAAAVMRDGSSPATPDPHRRQPDASFPLNERSTRRSTAEVSARERSRPRLLYARTHHSPSDEARARQRSSRCSRHTIFSTLRFLPDRPLLPMAPARLQPRPARRCSARLLRSR